MSYQAITVIFSSLGTWLHSYEYDPLEYGRR
jgi:hypothetical protein